MKVLVVDDEPDVRALVATALELAASDVVIAEAGDGEEALRKMREAPPDIVILDLALPSRDGFSVLEELRRESSLPVIVLTARGMEHDKVRGLELGADDYVTKPFGVRELVARVKALLRRADAAAPTSRVFGPLEIDTERKTVVLEGQAVDLTAMEYRLLELLYVGHAAGSLGGSINLGADCTALWC